MSKTRVRVEMDDEQKILLKRSLNKWSRTKVRHS